MAGTANSGLKPMYNLTASIGTEFTPGASEQPGDVYKRQRLLYALQLWPGYISGDQEGRRKRRLESSRFRRREKRTHKMIRLG